MLGIKNFNFIHFFFSLPRNLIQIFFSLLFLAYPQLSFSEQNNFGIKSYYDDIGRLHSVYDLRRERFSNIRYLFRYYERNLKNMSLNSVSSYFTFVVWDCEKQLKDADKDGIFSRISGKYKKSLEKCYKKVNSIHEYMRDILKLTAQTNSIKNGSPIGGRPKDVPKTVKQYQEKQNELRKKIQQEKTQQEEIVRLKVLADSLDLLNDSVREGLFFIKNYIETHQSVEGLIESIKLKKDSYNDDNKNFFEDILNYTASIEGNIDIKKDKILSTVNQLIAFYSSSQTDLNAATDQFNQWKKFLEQTEDKSKQRVSNLEKNIRVLADWISMDQDSMQQFEYTMNRLGQELKMTNPELLKNLPKINICYRIKVVFDEFKEDFFTEYTCSEIAI